MIKTIIEIIACIIGFLVITLAVKFIYKRIKNTRLFNPEKYLPVEEIRTLGQLRYLLMMLLFFIFILYNMIFQGSELTVISAMEILVTAYIAANLNYRSWKHILFFLIIVPYGSISYLGDMSGILQFFDLLRIFPYAYLMKKYYDKFKKYTESNNVGTTIVLLFSIIFISFIITTVVEGVGPLNSMVMVSNAFTSNGYTVLGTSNIGKINSIFLVWGGYILSGVSTATLAAALVTKEQNKKFEEIDKLNKKIDELKELIEEKDKK